MNQFPKKLTETETQDLFLAADELVDTLTAKRVAAVDRRMSQNRLIAVVTQIKERWQRDALEGETGPLTKINVPCETASPPSPEALRAKCILILQDPDVSFLEAIRYVRNAGIMGVGLKEAKEYIDALRDELRAKGEPTS